MKDLPTVGEIIELLKGFPQDARVVVSMDEEGNSYGRPGFYEPEYGQGDTMVMTIFPLDYWQAEEIFDWDREVKDDA